ncbi:nucleotide exchange factor SIL1 isoform X1 [Ceratitis capitata]|uniref:nucleotide exchange factor SIL1 isoform X1 n=1 Tax=Ceratitis capitata TaxID=7213 RepID=UPI00032A183B|nr:nucleotide exchange factor SIL1 isoform X1 [Ceratitis capitata]
MKFALSLGILLICEFAITSGKDENKTFHATNEWQEINDGQGVPAGLHIRINLQTGKKEAKLLSDEEDEDKNHHRNEGALTTVGGNVYGTNLKETTNNNLENSNTLSPESLKKIKENFKTYNELKESYKELQQKFQTDAELITGLIDEYKNLSREERDHSLSLQEKIKVQLRILEDLDYLVHQIDNALWFIDMGGLEQIILPLVVNETNINLRVKAVRVLGALTHNNPKAQIKAFEKNVGSHLAQILLSSTNTEELSSALYAFGSLLRKFPLALQRILSTSGTQALIAVLEKECELKVKAKSLTLISDVIVEKKLVLSNYADSDNPLAAAQYAELNLAEWLKSNAFCETVDVLVSSKLYELLDQPDLVEYFITGLESSIEICQSVWSKNPQLRHTLLTIKNRYMYVQDEFRLEIAQQIERLIKDLYNSINHEEL